MGIELVLVLFFGMILFGVPIAFAMISISTLYFLSGPIPSFVEIIPQKIFEGIDLLSFVDRYFVPFLTFGEREHLPFALVQRCGLQALQPVHALAVRIPEGHRCRQGPIAGGRFLGSGGGLLSYRRFRDVG